MTCMNIYGIHGANRKHRCHESKNYFNQCVQINHFMANDKKYHPQKYITDEYHHVTPHHDAIDIDTTL